MIRVALLFTLCLLFNSTFSQTVSAEASKNYVGKTVTVAGKVVDGRYLASTGRQPTLLNIDKPFPNQIFSIVIYGDDRKSFGYKPEEALLNKNVLVTGKVELYKGKPQITVTSPDQITIAPAGVDVSKVNDLKAAGSGDVKLKSAVKLRSGPGNDYKLIAKLKAGSVVHVLHADNGWAYVSVTRSAGKTEKDYTLNGFIKNEDLK
jgi:DNA/RNA endonuclease YhcR with UshA esterase domain